MSGKATRAELGRLVQLAARQGIDRAALARMLGVPEVSPANVSKLRCAQSIGTLFRRLQREQTLFLGTFPSNEATDPLLCNGGAS